MKSELRSQAAFAWRPRARPKQAGEHREVAGLELVRRIALRAARLGGPNAPGGAVGELGPLFHEAWRVS